MTYFFLHFILFIFSAFGESINSRFEAVVLDDDYISFNINLPNGYKIFPQMKQEVGIPTSFKMLHSQNVKSVDIYWPKYFQEEIFGKSIFIYKGNVSIPAKVTLLDKSQSARIEFEATYSICSEICIPVKQQIYVNIPNAAQANPSSKFFDHIAILAIALLAGFIMNFMPCVLPVLSIKALQGGHFFTICGIMFCFNTLGIICFALNLLGKNFGFGMTFQEPSFLVLLTLSLLYFADVAIKEKDLQIATLANIFNNKSRDFFSGIVITLLSTPCTAPLIGTVVSFATASSSIITTMLVFNSLGLGFSLPHVFFLLNKKINLPKKPPRFVKYTIVFLITCTILWILSLIHNQTGNRVLFATIFFLGFVKFLLDKEIKSPLVWFFIVLLGAFIPHKISQQNKISTQNFRWINFDEENIQKLISDDKVVMVTIGAEWCITCKINKSLVFDRDFFHDFAKKNDIIIVYGDLTNFNEAIWSFLNKNNSYGIPFTIIYGPKNKHGIKLPEIIKFSDIVNNYNLVR